MMSADQVVPNILFYTHRKTYVYVVYYGKQVIINDLVQDTGAMYDES